MNEKPAPLKPTPSQPNNPLHGITLSQMLEYLLEQYRWEE